MSSLPSPASDSAALQAVDTPALAADPMPEPPVAPDLDACCGNGCDPCIFDLHDLAMDAYRQSLRAWEARQVRPDEPPPTPSA